MKPVVTLDSALWLVMITELCSWGVGIRSPHHPNSVLYCLLLAFVSDGNIADDIFTVQIGGNGRMVNGLKVGFSLGRHEIQGWAAPNRQPLVDEVSES